MADVKLLLKRARKLIHDSKYTEAQKCCRKVLRKNKSNYLGLVLLGKSLQDADQALSAYQKAISAKPHRPLAWQELANYYERSEDVSSKIKLLSVYDKILKLQSKEENILEIFNKVGQLGCSLKNNKAISIIVGNMHKEVDEKYHVAAQKQLLELLKSDIICQDEDIPNILNHLTNILSTEQDESIPIIIGKVILQKNNFTEAVTEVIKLNYFGSSAGLREMLCQYLCKFYVKEDSFCELHIDQYMNEITSGIENCKYVILLKSMVCYHKKSYLEAFKLYVPLLNYQEADITEATFIIKCMLKLRKWQIAQTIATNFLITDRDINFTVTFKKFLLKSFAENRKWEQAKSLAKDIPLACLDVNDQALLARCYIECNEDAGDIMKNLQTSDHYIQLQALALIKQNMYNDVITLLETSLDNNPLNLFYTGKAHWELQNYDECYKYLSGAARLNTEHAVTFLYLGMLHQNFGDYMNAKQCFEKAYTLDSTDNNILQRLNNLYVLLNLTDSRFNLLYESSQNVEINRTYAWIRFFLGMYYEKRKDWKNAIKQFAIVRRTHPLNTSALIRLGNACLSQRLYLPALKAFVKLIRRDPMQILYCLTRFGFIYLGLADYDKAVIKFETVIKLEHYEMLLASKGIAVAFIKIAKEKYSAHLYGRARDNAQNAIVYLSKAMEIRPGILCFWSLFARALRLVTKLPNQYSFIYLKITSRDIIVKKNKLDIYSVILACYSRVAKEKKQPATYKLASTYLDYYHETKDEAFSLEALKWSLVCIQWEPSSSKYWELLGVIFMCINKYKLAERSFFNALRVTSNPSIWCNLGALYLKHKYFKPAHYCFSRGQACSHSYVWRWFGQGFIAQVIGKDDALDLFKNASHLGYHIESAIQDGDWMCRSIKCDLERPLQPNNAIDNLQSIPRKMDLLTWFSIYRPDYTGVSNILRMAEQRYAEGNERNIILINIGRIFLRLERCNKAAKVYWSITQISTPDAWGLALALVNKGQ